MKSLAHWLTDIGLESYAAAFAQNEVDFSVAHSLTAEDLRELGLSLGIAAPINLISLRLLQCLAVGGEYGGAAVYVAEHAPHGRRGEFTAWIQTTGTFVFLLSLLVILGTRTALAEATFADWGWRIPFPVSVVLLAIFAWIRLSTMRAIKP